MLNHPNPSLIVSVHRGACGLGGPHPLERYCKETPLRVGDIPETQ